MELGIKPDTLATDFWTLFPTLMLLHKIFFFFFRKNELVLKCFPSVKTDLISESGRTSGVGKGNLLRYSCLENPMATVHVVRKSLSTLAHMLPIPPSPATTFSIQSDAMKLHS